ncbi:TcfC E-set like domain-containing protein [Aeromonas sp. MdU4]|uniref:TcfC E-set like domain-containing protein n=1 Tax=Aeromonas sp. MdU4 TaxID=3342819 RepID=UPI0035B840EC
MKYLHFCVAVALLPVNTFANTAGGEVSLASTARAAAPDEFKALFEAKPASVELLLVNGNRLKVTGLLSYYHFKLGEQADTSELEAFLLDNDVSERGAVQVVAMLVEGVESDPSCRGDKDSCVVTPTGPLTAVVDSAHERVRLILDKSLYATESGQPEYVASYNDSPAFINHAALYTSYFSDQINVTLNDDSVLGLPYGYIRSRVTSNGYDSNIEPAIERLDYNYEFDQYIVSAGRSRDFNNINSSSLLSLSSIEKEGVFFGSSRNLARKPMDAYQRLYFYMPENGVAEVYRDGKLLFSTPMDAGQQFLSYDQLPAGNYSITLTLKAGERVLMEQEHAIVNTQDFKLTKGGVDFLVGASNATHADGRQLLVGEADLVYRPWDSFLFGAGAAFGGGGGLFKLAAKWIPSSDFYVQGMLGGATDDALYGTLTATYGSISLSYQGNRSVSGSSSNSWDGGGNAPERESTLSELLMGGYGSNRSLSLSGSYAMGAGSGYASAFYYENGNTSSLYSKSMSANIGYHMPIGSSSLGVNLGWSQPLGGERNDRNLTVGLNWSMSLGDNTSVVVTNQWDKQGGSSTLGSLRRNYALSERGSASLEVGSGYRNQQVEGTASGSLTYRGEMADISGSASTSIRGENNLFASISGSQVISGQGVHFTTKQSDSYLVLRDETPEASQLAESESNLASLQLGSRGQYETSLEYRADGSEQLVPLTNYLPYQVKLTTEEGRFYNRGEDDTRGFTHPGSVLSLVTEFGRERQLLGAFYNASGSAVTQLRCEGEGCLQVDKLEDGLFKVRLRESGEFRLMAERQECLASEDVPTPVRARGDAGAAGATGPEPLQRLSRVECRLPTENGKEKGPLLWSQQPHKLQKDTVVRAPDVLDGQPQAAVSYRECKQSPSSARDASACRS